MSNLGLSLLLEKEVLGIVELVEMNQETQAGSLWVSPWATEQLLPLPLPER